MKTNALLAAMMMILCMSCGDNQKEPAVENSNPPGKVTNVTVDNQPGQAEITYQLPSDPDLQYVKAVYKLNSGVIREVKASFYTNSMLLDGFGDTDIHDVEVFAVNRSGIASEPEIVRVKPLENPIWDVRRSLVVKDDFSGFNVSAENPAEHGVAIEIMMKNELGKWENLEGIETKLPTINQSKRGLDTLSYEISLTVRDRFLNYTDTLYTTVNPLYEVMLDKSKFKDMRLTGDAPIHLSTHPMSNMWNGVYAHTNSNRWLTNPSPDIYAPQVSTIDLGVPVSLSRITIFNWSYGTSTITGNRMMYGGEHLRYFEIWGMLGYPPNVASFDGWVKLGDFENIKPSGLPHGEETQEDFDVAVKGFDYTFPIEYATKVRYIRLKVIKTWSDTPPLTYGIAEIDVYGDTR
ncbi:MAG: DUF4959 domain-containing protein [Odoribacteraceae bacterium]|jgi:hypothetical protein|nr:DUF4959 domain-containing protein [Odoribacteraceae bacterium]